MERVMRIELTQSAWKAEVLPLNYTRRMLAEITNKEFYYGFYLHIYYIIFFKYNQITNNGGE